MKPNYKDRDYLHQAYIVNQLSTRQIAIECHVSYPTIARWLAHFGIPLRTRSEANMLRPSFVKTVSEEELCRLYWDEGLNLNQVADVLSVSAKTVRSAMIALGIPRRSTKSATRLAHSSFAATRYRDREWLEDVYHNQKMSLSQIARLLNCDDSTISKWMKRHGIETRSVGEALRVRAGW